MSRWIFWASRAAGGINICALDLAKIGEMIRCGGQSNGNVVLQEVQLQIFVITTMAFLGKIGFTGPISYFPKEGTDPIGTRHNLQIRKFLEVAFMDSGFG